MSRYYILDEAHRVQPLGEALIFDRKAEGGARQPNAREQAELDRDVRFLGMRQKWKQVAFR